jgi:hypothetical protein
MIGLLLKNWRFILDIILVIGLVVLFFIWNPFGIFGGELKLTPTTNMVTEVKQLGQLVTSEYYGEVISSIEESRLNLLGEEEIGIQGAQSYDDLYGALADLHDYQEKPLSVREAEYKLSDPVDHWKRIIRQDVNRRNILDKLNYHQLLGDLTSQPLYEELLEFIWSKSNTDAQWNSNNRHKEEALLLLYNDVENNRNTSLEEDAFIQFYFHKKSLKIPRKETKKKLAMIGRGWVKAGFDFSTMDNHTFYINEEAGEVHFFGLSPVVLNADINPWFIPEEGIPGFEILDYNGKVDFRDAKKVKQYCVEKLILNAHRAEIIKHAELNGAEIIKSLFSLMTGEEIKKVFFHNEEIIRLTQEIAEDEFVNYHEATLLDSQITKEWESIDSLNTTRENSFKNQQLAQHRRENLKIGIQMLKKLPFLDLPGTFNFFSKRIYEMAEDSVLEDDELKQLEIMRIRWSETSPTTSMGENFSFPALWVEDTLSYTTTYNQKIEYLINRGIVTGSVEETTLPRAALTPEFLKDNWVKDFTYLDSVAVQVTLFKEEQQPQKALIDLLYPFNHEKVTWDIAMTMSNIWLDSTEVEGVEKPILNDSTTLVYFAGDVPRIKILNFPLNKLVNSLIIDLLGENSILWITPDVGIIVGNNYLDELHKPKNYFLSKRQSEEMGKYLSLLLTQYHYNKSKGPIVRANEWMQKKFEDNQPVGKWFTELKKKLGD